MHFLELNADISQILGLFMQSYIIYLANETIDEIQFKFSEEKTQATSSEESIETIS